MPQLFANNAAAMLASTISPTATQLTIDPARSGVFRLANTTDWVSPGDWFKVTLEDADGNMEIIYVGVHTSGSPTFDNLLRGQEGTTARSWTAGEAIVEIRLTRADVEAVITGGFASRSVVSTNGVDFDNLIASGVYPLSGDGTWTGSSHAPIAAAANGQVEVFANGTFVVQELATFNPISFWRRGKVASTWGNWYRMDAADATAVGRALMAAASKTAARAVFVEDGLKLSNYGIVNSLACFKTGEALPTTDVGPIWHADFASIMFWQLFSLNGANYSGYASQFVGRLEPDSQPTPRIGQVKTGFTNLSKVARPQLWNWALHNNLVESAASWSAGRQVYCDNGDGTFKGPDLRAKSIRIWDDGAGVDAGRLFGSAQLDAIQNIVGAFNGIMGGGLAASGAFSVPLTYNNQISSGVIGSQPSGFTFDASRVVRTASETRVANFVQLGSIQL